MVPIVLEPGKRTPTLLGQEPTSANTPFVQARDQPAWRMSRAPGSGSCCPWSASKADEGGCCLLGRDQEHAPAAGLRGVGGAGAVRGTWAPTVPPPALSRAPTATRGTRGPRTGRQVSGDRIRERPEGRRGPGAGVRRWSGRDTGRPEPGEQSPRARLWGRTGARAEQGPLTSLGGSRSTPHPRREKEGLRWPEVYLREAWKSSGLSVPSCAFFRTKHGCLRGVGVLWGQRAFISDTDWFWLLDTFLALTASSWC